MKRSTSLLLAVLAGAAPSLHADVKMPSIFGDHMVLQQAEKIPVWGTADPGENIQVTIGPSTAKVQADAQGQWRVNLPTVPINTLPQNLTVTGATTTLTFQDVLVGDVWLAAGGPNLALTLHDLRGRGPGVDDAIAGATNAELRLFLVRGQTGLFPLATLQGSWQVSSPEAAAPFPAAAYFFGSDLQRALVRPIGLIAASSRSATLPGWLSFEALQALPFSTVGFGEIKKQRDAFTQSAIAQSAGQPAPASAAAGDPPTVPILEDGQSTTLYNGMINPLIPYGIKGAIWYDGVASAQANGGAGDQGYNALLKALITDWRTRWAEGNFPFLIVGLANHGDRYPMPADSGWARIREAQVQATESLPGTALAETLDLGDTRDLHPTDQLEVGRRLAAAAGRVAYGQNVPFAGPSFASMTVEGGSVRIKFRNVGTGLMLGASPFVTAGNPAAATTELTGFTMAAADKRWVPAQATIVGDDVMVSSDQITIPAAVRYGWSENPEMNLYNKDGFPAVPFRTDDWPYVPPPRRYPSAGRP